jgi:hypothetical protein
MERSLGLIEIEAKVLALLGGVLGGAGGAQQAHAEVVAGGSGLAFSPEAQRRAVLDRAWTQAMEARCMAPSPFAAPTVLPAVC